VLMIIGGLMWLQPLFQRAGDIFDIVIFNPALYCSLKYPGPISLLFLAVFKLKK